MNEYEEPFRCVEVAADRAAEQVLREDKLLREWLDPAPELWDNGDEGEDHLS